MPMTPTTGWTAADLPSFAGRTVIHIVSDSDPGEGFEAVQGDLEDVYFSTLTSHRKAA